MTVPARPPVAKAARRTTTTAAVLSAALLASAALTAVPAAGQAAEADAEAQTYGCSYGTGGPSAEALCWIDMSGFGSVEASTMPVDQEMTISLGRYEVTMTATVSAGTDGANGVASSAFQTWGGSLLGGTWNDQPYYVSPAGKPALYQINNSAEGTNMQRDTVSLSDITVMDTATNTRVTSGYSLVVTDAESTGNGEGFTWSSDKPLTKYQTVTPSGWSEPCVGGLTGIGTTDVDCTGGVGIGGRRGILMVSADSPTTISSTFRNNGGSSRQGVAFALVFSAATAGVDVAQSGGSDAEFTVTARNGDNELTSTTSNDGSSTSTPAQFLSETEPQDISYTVERSGGSTPLTAYDVVWSCTVNGSPAEPVLSADGLTATVQTPPNGASACTATATASGPSTGPQSAVINPDQTATLSGLATTPGNGAITSATFDNGETTKTVPGEGVWSIELVDGQPVATFTPEKGYTGPVTQQPYTVTDENGLTATSTLNVDINTPPTTGDDTATVAQGEKATLSPTAKPGNSPLTGVAFDNGETSTTVPGEGVWSTELVDGQPVATFTPEDGFTGAVTPQPYTVTDENGLSASGELNVIIEPATGDDAATILPNTTATL
ncbi:MAG: Ig-like domain-containing protein, partial [Mycetocola reblochoni]